MNSRQMIPGGSPLGKGSVYLEARFIILTSFLVTSNLLEIPETFINSAFFLFNQCEVYSSFLPQHHFYLSFLKSHSKIAKSKTSPLWKKKLRFRQREKNQECNLVVDLLTEVQTYFPRLMDGTTDRRLSCLLEIASTV